MMLPAIGAPVALLRREVAKHMCVAYEGYLHTAAIVSDVVSTARIEVILTSEALAVEWHLGHHPNPKIHWM
jgi:hypothetical protein